MSDEKNNMNDIHKTEDQLADQAFSEEIRRKLAEPGSGKPTLEEFKLMVYKDREKRRKKRSAMVACIVIACLAGYFAFDQLVPEVGADKNPKEEIVTEDGVIIEDGGYGSSEEEDNVWVTEDWEQVEDGKKLFPQLVIPNYIPEEYSFEKLEIEAAVKNDIICRFIYCNDKNKKLEIEVFISEGESVTNINEEYEKVEIQSGSLFINDKEKTAIANIEDSIVINVWHDLTKEELIKIIEHIKRSP